MLLRVWRKRGADRANGGQAQVFRDPANLAQPDSMGCLSAVVANILYMFGKTASPLVGYVDRELGREPGKLPLNSINAELFLLGEGFCRECIGPFDSDRAISEGLAYYREDFAEEWNSTYAAYFTPEKVRELQEKRRASKRIFQKFAERNRETVKHPTLGDIDALLEQGNVVVVDLEHGAKVSVHACLIYGKSPDGEYEVYRPAPKRLGKKLETLFLFTPEEFARAWCAKNGISAYRLER